MQNLCNFFYNYNNFNNFNNFNLNNIFIDEIYLMKLSLINKGYFEVINYSFISDKFEKLFNDFFCDDLIIKNPISNDMNMMRTTLISGLLLNLKYNLSRQKNNIKIFEFGKIFVFDNDTLLFKEKNLISGVATGNIFFDQWGIKSKKIDFFDIKNDILFLFDSINKNFNLSFINSLILFFDINESVNIYLNNLYLGCFGLIKIDILNYFFIDVFVYSFEIEIDILLLNNFKFFVKKVSKYPYVSRDLTFLIKNDFLSKDILIFIYSLNISILKDILILDVYNGSEIPKYYKSISFRFLMQSYEMTLLDDTVNFEINKIISVLSLKYGAILR